MVRKTKYRTVKLDSSQKPTAEQIKQIEEAKKRDIVFDEDSPERDYEKKSVNRNLL